MAENDPTKKSNEPFRAYPIKVKGHISLMHRFVTRVGQVLGLSQAEASHVKQLDGRIEEMQLKVHRTLALLQAVRLEMEETLDDDLFSHAVSILDPLIRELKRMHVQPPHTDTLPRFEGWINKAKRWEKLSGKPLRREAIIATLIEHAITETVESVERDIRVILVYLRHRLDELDAHPTEKDVIEAKVKTKVKPLFEKLQKLPYSFNPTTLEQLVSHKNHFNIVRQQYHETALAIIDKHIN